jgi:hypothetical protein
MSKKIESRDRSATLAGAVVLAALVASGCASVGAPQQSNTLTSFEQLSVQPDGTRTWRDPAAGRPESVQIGPGAVVFGAGVFLDEEQRLELQRELVGALRLRFAEAGIRVIESPNVASTSTLRVTITAVALASPAVNAMTSLLLFAPLSHGGMTVELEALDSQTNRRVAAMAFEGRAGVQNIGSAFSSLGHAKVQAEVVAERFALLVSGARAKAL